MALVIISSGEEIRNREGADLIRITAKPFCDQQEVQICADRKTNSCPADFGNTREVSQTRETHQQVTAHVGCLRAHCCDDRSERTTADIEISRTAAASAPVEVRADEQHRTKIHNNCKDDQHL